MSETPADLSLSDIASALESLKDGAAAENNLATFNVLDRLAKDVRGLEERYEGEFTQYETEAETALATIAKLTTALQAKADAAVLPVAQTWSARATDQDWDALIAWVDELRCTWGFKTLGRYLPPCWPAHPAVVEDLAATHLAWIHACLAMTPEEAEESTSGSLPERAMSFWFRDHLHPLITRLSTIYDFCGSQHQENMPPKPTEAFRKPESKSTGVEVVLNLDETTAIAGGEAR